MVRCITYPWLTVVSLVTARGGAAKLHTMPTRKRRLVSVRSAHSLPNATSVYSGHSKRSVRGYPPSLCGTEGTVGNASFMPEASHADPDPVYQGPPQLLEERVLKPLWLDPSDDPDDEWWVPRWTLKDRLIAWLVWLLTMFAVLSVIITLVVKQERRKVAQDNSHDVP